MTAPSFLPPPRETRYSVERAHHHTGDRDRGVWSCPICADWQIDADTGVSDLADRLEHAIRGHMDPCLNRLDDERFGASRV